MNLTYAVADLHGAYDLFEQAIVAIEEHACTKSQGSRTIVFTGDYIDRGPQSRQIVEHLMLGADTMANAGWKWIALKGNHEDMMLETFDEDLDSTWWIGNGGEATLTSYDVSWVGQIPKAHFDFLRALPTIFVDQHRVFVHAGVHPDVPLEHQSDEHRMWTRVAYEVGHGDRFVVHGHTPHRNGPLVTKGRINLDTYAWLSGRLVVAVFEDDQAGGPVQLIEVRR